MSVLRQQLKKFSEKYFLLDSFDWLWYNGFIINQNFPQMKIVVTTHGPEIVAGMMNDDGAIINLPEDYLSNRQKKG